MVIQTYMPDHPSVLFAKKHDFLNFFAHEKSFREEFHYPPYRSLVNIIVRSRDEKKAYVFAREVRDEIRRKFLIPGASLSKDLEGTGAVSPEPEAVKGLELIGPAPLPFYKLRGHFRWHVMIKIPGGENLTAGIYALLMGLRKPSGVAFAMDVDPLNIL